MWFSNKFFKELYMSDGGKGSSRRPMSISQQEWDSRWDAIFGRDISDYQDILSTEDCVLEAFDSVREVHAEYIEESENEAKSKTLSVPTTDIHRSDD
jgi:hypothetical protein